MNERGRALVKPVLSQSLGASTINIAFCIIWKTTFAGEAVLFKKPVLERSLVVLDVVVCGFRIMCAFYCKIRLQCDDL